MESLITKVNENPLSRRKFIGTGIIGSLAGSLSGSLINPISAYSEEENKASSYNISTSDYRVVGNPNGKTVVKVGMDIANTKYFMKGDLTKLPGDLSEKDFYNIIEPIEKKTQTLLLYDKVSKNKIRMEFLKFAKKMKIRLRTLTKDKYFFTSEDVTNTMDFLDSLDLKPNYFKGTISIIETGNESINPRYTIYDSEGNRTTYKQTEDSKISNSVRKFFNFQSHWYDFYQDTEHAPEIAKNLSNSKPSEKITQSQKPTNKSKEITFEEPDK